MKIKNLIIYALVWSAIATFALRPRTAYADNPKMTSAGSTFNRGDFTSTNAFFWSSLDLSQLAGIDTGSARNYIVVLDVAGKVATGYLAGVGAGETLGSELITGWTNATYDTFVSSGKDITSAIDTSGTCIGVSNTTSKNSGELLKFVSTLTLNSGQAPSVAYDGFSYILGALSAGLNNIYHNTLNKVDTAYRIYNIAVANWSSINSSKPVTDPPSTAVHIVSSLNGTTRAWESVESGFDPNSIASWIIYGSPANTRIFDSRGPVDSGMMNSGPINSGMIR